MVNILYRLWNSPTFMTWGNMLSSSGKLLILTPLILIKYDVNEIAFWFLLLTIQSLMVVVDFGFQPTFSRIISFAFNGLDKIVEISSYNKKREIGKTSWSFIERIYATVNSTYLVLSVLVFIVVVAASYPSVKILAERALNQSTLWWAYFIFMASFVFSFFARRSEIFIIGTNHIALINRWNILNNLSSSIVSICIVYFNLGIGWLALNQLVFSILLLLRNYWLEIFICDKRFKNFIFFRFDLDIFKWVWTPAWKSGILILASTGLTQFTGLFYSSMSTSAELASYLLTLKLVTTISQFSQAPFYSKLPIFSGLRLRYEADDLSNETMRAMFKALLIFVIGISCLFFFGEYFLSLVNSSTQIQPPLFIILMALVWFLERHHSMHTQIYVTTNKIPFYKTMSLSGVINICLMYLLVPRFGVWGFPLSLGLSNLVINNWWNVKISLKSMRKKFWPYFRSSALVPLLLLLSLSAIKVIFFN